MQTSTKMASVEEDSAAKLDLLRALLLEDERLSRTEIEQEVNHLREILLQEDKFSEHLAPHLSEQLTYLKENFPDLFGRYLGEAIKIQIRDSQDEVVDALYPIIGQLIGTYVRKEIKRISGQIDEKLKDPFSLDSLKMRWKAFTSGVKYEEYLLQKGMASKIEEIFIIDKVSGMLLGHHSIKGITPVSYTHLTLPTICSV